jgi:hypothetical protein
VGLAEPPLTKKLRSSLLKNWDADEPQMLRDGPGNGEINDNLPYSSRKVIFPKTKSISERSRKDVIASLP